MKVHPAVAVVAAVGAGLVLWKLYDEWKKAPQTAGNLVKDTVTEAAQGAGEGAREFIDQADQTLDLLIETTKDRVDQGSAVIDRLKMSAIDAALRLPARPVAPPATVNLLIGDRATAQLSNEAFNAGVKTGEIRPYSEAPNEAGFVNGFYYDPNSVLPQFKGVFR